MKILFLTLIDINSINERGLYQDLLREFSKNKHSLYIVSPTERRKKKKTYLIKDAFSTILKVKTLNIQKANLIEKGIGTFAIEHQYLSAIKKNFKDICFDLVLYSTPPITFTKVIQYIKNRDNTYSYLLLKDIFPQNAVDLGMLNKGNLLYKFFRKKEKKLYEVSDAIGCMSQANVKYIKDHNPNLDTTKIEENPNTIDPVGFNLNKKQRISIRKKYNLPTNNRIFVYGGNLGKPQGLDFLLQTIEKNKHPNVFFLIVGNGTEYNRMNKWFIQNKPNNAKLLNSLPKGEYDLLLSSCDVGLIFLNKYFSIPNFPSRLLSYLEMKMPVIAATDKNTDIGDIIENANCGLKVISGNHKLMQQAIDLFANKESLEDLNNNSYKLLQEKYKVEISYSLIINKINNNQVYV
ncbi:glycosyltransferase family 4 protein [Polaribacter sp. MSW13]|uniref:Glycosyltransferase family 4 protein n=1 Tax=Polaribacter marinus TaxID=2916838 RepID=A0A9X2AIQ0_9FLAO|nr:glycosyltransferase family 4 protein [Polaribacter marinus]MCI2227548.1 glycosyltransferase family 4 protein [Polaribacter marinus]